jgi:hypothetical protein
MAAPARSLDRQFRLLLPEEISDKPRLVPPPPPAPPGERAEVRELRASLAARVGARVTSATELLRALDNRRRDELLPTALAPLDALLGGGLPRGKVVEIAGRVSTGRFSMVMAALAAATSAGEAAALIDLGDHLDPRIAEAIGVDLRRLLWVRPHTLKQAVMSVEMLTATGFQLVALDAGSHPIRGRRVPDATWVRLARSAKAHGTVMLISTPYPLTGTASEAVVSAFGARAKWSGRGKSPRILIGIESKLMLKKHRHIRPGRVETLSLRTYESCLA